MRGLGGKTTATLSMATWRIKQRHSVSPEPWQGVGRRGRKRNAAYLLIKRAYEPDASARSTRLQTPPAAPPTWNLQKGATGDYDRGPVWRTAKRLVRTAATSLAARIVLETRV